MQYDQGRAWAEISTDALEHNFRCVKGAVKDARVCCVIKADAYGHGAVQLGRIYQALGADFLAVATVKEALTLRQNGVTLPILILGYAEPTAAPLLSEQGISLSLYSAAHGAALAEAMAGTGRRLSVHIKIDTGMGRLGFSEEEGEVAALLSLLRGNVFQADGIFTHFSRADMGEAGREATQGQLARFCRLCDRLQAEGIAPPLRHAAASAAIFDYPEAHLDMVRSGIALYGVLPSKDMRSRPPLLPAMVLKARVVAVRRVRRGGTVGYGGAYVAEQDRQIAILAIGYADGIRRTANRERWVELGDRLVPLVGRVCMDMCAVDVTGSQVAVGDIATVYGMKSGGVAAAAEAAQTIAYELLTAVGPRVPRIYL